MQTLYATNLPHKHHGNRQAGEWPAVPPQAVTPQSWRVGQMMTRGQLSQFLGGPSTLLDSSATDLLPASRLELMPGNTLYAQGTVALYVYIVQAGLLMCTREPAGTPDASGTVSFVGAGDLLGPHDTSNLRLESVRAIARTQLLALPADDLRQMKASSPLLDELICRSQCLALMRNSRVTYRLRHLPPFARTVAALAHLIELARVGHQRDEQAAPSLEVHLPVEDLRRWLGLPLPALSGCLTQLQHYAALSCRKDHLVALNPQPLLTLASTLNLSWLDTTVGWSQVSEARPGAGSGPSLWHPAETGAALCPQADQRRSLDQL